MKSLRDATPEMLAIPELQNNPDVYRRCRYVIQENIRVTAACDDLTQNRISEFGRKMYETHEGLSKDYLVSCEELDFLVDEARKHDAVLGARMMGGGFGGCTINLVRDEALDPLISDIERVYYGKFHTQPAFYRVKIMDGVSGIELDF